MKLGIIFDTHAGDGSPADDFRGVERDVLGTVDYLERTVDRTIFGGDIEEALPGQNSGRTWKERKLNCRRAHPTFFAKIDDRALPTMADGEKRRILLGGNHDPRFARRREYLHVDHDSKLVVKITHGHEYDVFNSKYKPVGDAIAWLVGKLERNGWPEAEHILSGIAKRITGSDPTSRQSTYKKALKADVARIRDQFPGYQVIRGIGHTHVLTHEELPAGDVIFQGGKCCSGRVQYVIIDTSTRHLSLKGG